MKWDVDLRPELEKLGMTARSQGNRGTCSVFAMTFCIEFLLRKKRLVREPLSVEFLNWAKNQATGQKKDGDFFDRIALGYERYGMLPEMRLPYASTYERDRSLSPALLEQARQTPRLTGRFVKPWSVTEVVTETQVAEIKACLKRGVPVAVGLRWPKNGKLKNESTEGLPVMAFVPASAVFDGHSVGLVGYSESGKAWLFANWAGAEWSDHGFGYMSDAYFRAYLNDAFVYE